MKLITRRMLIQNVAAKWHAQYARHTLLEGTLHDGRSKAAIYADLLTLDGDTATCDDVARIIGNDSWTDLKCDECGTHVEAVVRLGQEPDYESATAWVCMECLGKAMSLGAHWRPVT